MKTRVVRIALASLLAAACSKDEGEKKKASNEDEVELPPGGATKVARKPQAQPTPGEGESAPDDLVARGKYVANVAGCVGCHTDFTEKGPDVANAWGGGLTITEAFGTWVSPNITPHEETGIGSWTDEQIIAAVREGKRPDGDGLYPIMPYLFYNAMSDADAEALVAYMRSLPAVDRKIERPELKLPKIPAPPPKGEDPGEDPKARGAYLASIMHCAACHVPVDAKGIPDMKRAYAGGMRMEVPETFGKGHLYAPNITPDEKTGIGSWTEEQIATSITRMTRPDGTPILGPMMMYVQGWSQMTDEDVAAIAAFIKSLPAIENEVPPSEFTPAGPPPGHGK